MKSGSQAVAADISLKHGSYRKTFKSDITDTEKMVIHKHHGSGL